MSELTKIVLKMLLEILDNFGLIFYNFGLYSKLSMIWRKISDTLL